MATRMESLFELIQKQMEQKDKELELHREEMRRAQEESARAQEESERRHLEQKEESERRHQEQNEESERRHQEQMLALIEKLEAKSAVPSVPQSAAPNFSPFDSTSELWNDYWCRFNTFAKAHSVQEGRKAQVFLTNQTSLTYKLLSNLADQENPPKEVNSLTMTEIVAYMKAQFDPKRFVVRERYKYWSDMRRKTGESIIDLAARIRQAAATCDFASIQRPLDEALRTRFMCSVNNESVLKALFKVKDDQLTFARAIEVATEVEDAAKVSKECCGTNDYGTATINKVKSSIKSTPKEGDKTAKRKCYRCGKPNHLAPDCRFKDSVCNYCNRVGHLEAVCRTKEKQNSKPTKPVKHIKNDLLKTVSGNPERLSKLEVPVKINEHPTDMELDTATGGNFVSSATWVKLGKPTLGESQWTYQSASKHSVPILGSFSANVSFANSENIQLTFEVTEISDLNLLGRDAIKSLNISVDKLLCNSKTIGSADKSVLAVFDDIKPDLSLQKDCSALCKQYEELFKPELGCLKNYELEVNFKPDASATFCKPRPVPFAIRDDLARAYDEGIAKGIWTPTEFNDWGSPVVPVKKARRAAQARAKLRVCGDYSVAVNKQLQTHRHPLPLPEDLMSKLKGGYGFTKIDLADAYNQVKLGPISRKRLALSTHRGVLLQNVLPFGISSAPGYFQKIMDNITCDLPGVVVFLDDILVSGSTADEHLQNLRHLLDRLLQKGLRCRYEKCEFALPKVEYLGHVLSKNGISKGSKVDAVRAMPPPKDVTSLRSFLGSVQFYSKFLPPGFSETSEPLYRLTRKGIQWKWDEEEESAFNQMKEMLSSNNVLAYFDPTLTVGISCDASNVGIGAVLFHRFGDGTERPIANVSKILTKSQRNYSQIQKEALSIIFALKKFYHYLFGRKFILVTDHKPLLSIFGPEKPTPALAANRLARWALFLNQFEYSVEYRKTSQHANADSLSRLPADGDTKFDGEESVGDAEIVCQIQEVSRQIVPADANSLRKESGKDPIVSVVMRYTREGWPHILEGQDPVMKYKSISNSLSVAYGCLLYGCRVVIPGKLRNSVLHLLHQGHFGMQRMKQLARTAVYWPNMDDDIKKLCHECVTCAEHQNRPPKAPTHPWMLPEKPWSRLHIDHAINFMGYNWLVIVDAYTKYPCIHATKSVSAKATMDILEKDFAHFGYPHSIVSDNASAFMSDEFQEYCKERGIIHLTGAPYHPATNGLAERMIQTFKKAMKKSSFPPKTAVVEFLMQYRRTPSAIGFSPSELLNKRQIRTRIDTLLPSPVHMAQSQQVKSEGSPPNTYEVGDACYALYCGPRRTETPRWVPAVIVKHRGTTRKDVKIYPNGTVWKRHIDQLRPRYGQSKMVTDTDEAHSNDIAIEPRRSLRLKK